MPYRASPKAHDVKRSKINNMPEMTLKESAQRERSLPVVFKPGENGTLRFSADYREINAATIWGSCQLPIIDECIDSGGDHQVCSTHNGSGD